MIGRKVDGATIFEIASLTKVFTALVLADMAGRHTAEARCAREHMLACWREGACARRASRSLSSISPRIAPVCRCGRPTSASQTALNKYAGYTVEQLYQSLATFELPRDPGTEFTYSNWGFGLLANALAHCSGKSYEALLAERVTGPLGMRDTTFGPTGTARSRLAAAYDAKLQPVPNEGLGALAGAGGLYSTVNDLLAFIEVFLGRGPQQLIAVAPTMLEPRRPGDDPSTRMGLGWRVTTNKGGDRTVWSSGRADGYRAFMAIDPQARVAVVALTNAATNVGVDDIGWHVLDPSVAITPPHPRISVSADVLERYVGRYLFDDGVFMTVVRDDDHLVVQMDKQGPSPIFASGPREFFPEDIEAQFVFDESGAAPAPSLVLHQDGNSYKAVRVTQEAAKK